jgi:hypothetical protein
MPTPGGGPLIYAYNLNNDHLISFNAGAPGIILSDVAITGLQMGEFLIGLDFRPAGNNQLYSVAVSGGSSRVVTIDLTTGALTQIGPNITPSLSSQPYYGIDFNPTVDRIRVVNEDNLSIRLHPTTGALAGTDTPLAYAAGDPSAGQDPRVAHVAYDQNAPGGTTTTLFGIDFANDNLVRIGGVNGTPSPNLGALTTVGPLGVATNPANGGFDIETGTGNAYASLNVGGVSRLYRINLATGAATLIDSIGGAPFIDGIAIARTPAPATDNTVQFSVGGFTGNESETGQITVTRTGSTTGTTTVTLTPAGGTATGGATCASGVDFINTPVTVTFAPGQTTQTVPITLCPDRSINEANETIILSLTGPGGGLLGGQNTATLTVNDTATQFRNTTPITINSGGPASPYPSTINVTGAAVGIASMRVTLYRLSHNFPDHVDVLLVGPTGRTFVIMGDSGGGTAIPETAPVTLSLSDMGTALLPNAGPLVTCQCEPTTWETPVTNFPAPAPAGPYNEARSVVGNGPGIDTFAEAFGGTEANGTWSLYVRDDNGVALPPEVVNGMIAGGWGIEFFGPTAANVTLSGRVTTAEGNGLRNARVTITGDSLERPLTTTTGTFGYYQFEGLEAGQTYLVTVGSKRFTFQAPSRVITLVDNVSDFDFIALSP